MRLARALALASLRESWVQLDVPAVQEALAEIIRGVGEVQGMKFRMTSISKATGEVSDTLDGIADGAARREGRGGPARGGRLPRRGRCARAERLRPPSRLRRSSLQPAKREALHIVASVA